MRCAAYAPNAERYADSEIAVAVRRLDRRPEGGPLMQPLRWLDLARSMFGCPDRCARSAFGCPLPHAGPYRRRTRLGKVLGAQLTKCSALPLFGNPWIGRSAVRISSVTPFTSLPLAHRFVRRNHRRRVADELVEMLEAPFEVLSRMTGSHLDGR